MKSKHWIFLVLVIVGGFFLLHNYMSHGGFAGVKHGMGLGGMTA